MCLDRIYSEMISQWVGKVWKRGADLDGFVIKYETEYERDAAAEPSKIG